MGALQPLPQAPQPLFLPPPGILLQGLPKKFVHHSSAEVHAIYQKFSVKDQGPMLEGIRRYRDAEAEVQAILAGAAARSAS